MQTQLDFYNNLAGFISQTLGPSYTVSLYNFQAENKNNTLVYSSGDKDDGAISIIMDYIQKLYSNLHSEQEPCLYDIVFPDSADERTNIFFLPEENGMPLGAITVSCNIGERNRIISSLQAMLNMTPPSPARRPHGYDTEKAPAIPQTLTSDMLPMLVASILREHSIEPGQAQLSPDEKIKIISILNERGVFMLKNAVVEVAAQLKSSECTIYRYLSKLNRKTSDNVWEPVRLV